MLQTGKNQMSDKLYDRLKQLNNEESYPFHMPGHKRNFGEAVNPYELDVTEIPGFDNAHDPQGVLKHLNDRLARMYDADGALALVNGSTSGNLIAISSALPVGGHMLMARNSHISAFNAASLRGLHVTFLYPAIDAYGICDKINPDDVDKALSRNPLIKAVFIVSPTYEGVISDVKAIAEVCHRRGAVLIVDSAHGAHIGLHVGDTPGAARRLESAGMQGAIEAGADIAVMSLHKTLPSYTQTAVICYKGERVNASAVKHFFDVYVSTSPSYILMSGIERCVDHVDGAANEFREFYNRIRKVREELSGLKNLKLLTYDDPGKILLASPVKYEKLYDEFMAMGITAEMQLGNYVLFMTSPLDTQEGFDRLIKAARKIDSLDVHKVDPLDIREKTEEIDFSRSAYIGEKEIVIPDYMTDDSEYVYEYPPGIPLRIPGEQRVQEIPGE